MVWCVHVKFRKHAIIDNIYISKRNIDFFDSQFQYITNNDQFDACIAMCWFYSYAMIV